MAPKTPLPTLARGTRSSSLHTSTCHRCPTFVAHTHLQVQLVCFWSMSGHRCWCHYMLGLLSIPGKRTGRRAATAAGGSASGPWAAGRGSAGTAGRGRQPPRPARRCCAPPAHHYPEPPLLATCSPPAPPPAWTPSLSNPSSPPLLLAVTVGVPSRPPPLPAASCSCWPSSSAVPK